MSERATIATPVLDAQAVQKVILENDVASLSPPQKVTYVKNLCESLGLNFLTKPFEIIKFQGKEKLYATKDCTEQLRKIYNISLRLTDAKMIGNELYTVTVEARYGDRVDFATGVVSMCIGDKPLTGDARANAIMKCETKAKRRATLSVCGLGILDESEIETLPSPVHVPINYNVPIDYNKTPEKIEIKQSLLDAMKKTKGLKELQVSFQDAVNHASSNKDRLFLDEVVSLKESLKQTIMAAQKKEKDQKLDEGWEDFKQSEVPDAPVIPDIE